MDVDTVLGILQELFDARGYGESKRIDNDNGCGLETDNVLAFIINEPKLTVGAMKSFFILLEEKKLHHGIIVYDVKITAQTNNLISEQLPDDYRIELFKGEHLMYNPTKHYLVPHHVKLTPEQIASELGKIDPKDLSEIRHDDKIVKFLGFVPGDILRIHRQDKKITYLRVRDK